MCKRSFTANSDQGNETKTNNDRRVEKKQSGHEESTKIHDRKTRVVVAVVVD